MLTSVLCSVQDVRGSSKSFPKHEAKHVSDHKVRMILVFPCYCTATFVSIASLSENLLLLLHILHLRQYLDYV